MYFRTGPSRLPYLRGCLHVKSHTGTSFTLVRVVKFIPRLHGPHKYWHRDDAWTKTIMASNEVLLLSMFSFAASAILLANTIANLLLYQIVVRRFNMARATALGCSPLSCCILKKRKINSRQTPLLGETRKNGFMVAKHDSKSLFGRGLEKKLQNEQKLVHEVGWLVPEWESM